MNILKGRQANDIEEATLLAIHAAGESGLSPDVVTIFVSTLDVDKLKAQAERSIGTAVHGRYGRGARWHGKPWFVPLPQPRYVTQPIPKITFTVQAYVVAPVEVDTRDYLYRATVVGPLNKPVEVILPISFLQAILDGEIEQFEVAGKDARSTSWSIPGFREPLWLPNDFTARLSAALRLKSVASWLLDFGSSGEAVLPQVVGSLLGLQSRGMTEALPVGKQPFRREVVIEALTRMYGSAIAAEMYQRQAPHLKPAMSNNEVVGFIIKEEGGGFRRWNMSLDQSR